MPGTVWVQLTYCRFVLADTTQLHTKITEMGQRIRELEDALTALQSRVSTERHPLLRDELLAIKFGPDKSVPTNLAKQDRPRTHSTESIDALGTLTIDDRGEARYFGRSAGSEVRVIPSLYARPSATIINSQTLLLVCVSNNPPFQL